MKIVEGVISFLIGCFIFYILYLIAFILPKLQEEIKISRGDLKVLTEYKLKHPEFVGPLCKKALSDNFITRKEYYEIVREIKKHEELLLYKQLTE
jgi:hypothetical protein